MFRISTMKAPRLRDFGRGRSAGLALAAASLAVATMVATVPAEAQYWHHHHHDDGAVAAGVIGGLALGAVVGSALAEPPPPPVVYEEEDDYPVVDEEQVYVRRLPSCADFRRVDWRERVWIDNYGREHPCS